MAIHLSFMKLLRVGGRVGQPSRRVPTGEEGGEEGGGEGQRLVEELGEAARFTVLI